MGPGDKLYQEWDAVKKHGRSSDRLDLCETLYGGADHSSAVERVVGCNVRDFLQDPGSALRHVLLLYEAGSMLLSDHSNTGCDAMISVFQCLAHHASHSINPVAAEATALIGALPTVLDIAAIPPGNRVLSAALGAACALIRTKPCADALAQDKGLQGSLAHLLGSLRRPPPNTVDAVLQLFSAILDGPEDGVSILLRYCGVGILCHCARSPNSNPALQFPAVLVCRMLRQLIHHPGAAFCMGQERVGSLLVDLMLSRPVHSWIPEHNPLEAAYPCHMDNRWATACETLCDVYGRGVGIAQDKMKPLLAQLALAIEHVQLGWLNDCDPVDRV